MAEPSPTFMGFFPKVYLAMGISVPFWFYIAADSNFQVDFVLVTGTLIYFTMMILACTRRRSGPRVALSGEAGASEGMPKGVDASQSIVPPDEY